MQRNFYAAVYVAIHTVPIFVPPGTHYYWMDRICDRWDNSTNAKLKVICLFGFDVHVYKCFFYTIYLHMYL